MKNEKKKWCLKCHPRMNYFCLLQFLLQLPSLKIFKVQVQTLLKLVGLHHFFPMDWLLVTTWPWPVRITNCWEPQEGTAFSSTLPSQTALTGTNRKDNQHSQEHYIFLRYNGVCLNPYLDSSALTLLSKVQVFSFRQWTHSRWIGYLSFL